MNRGLRPHLRARFPAPRVASADAPALRAALQAFGDATPERWSHLFLDGRPLKLSTSERRLLEPALAAGLLRRRLRGDVRPCVRLLPFDGRYFATDVLGRQAEDQVFSIMFEQVYLNRTMQVTAQDAVLELCVGSGANAVLAADVARKVVGVDINPRAIAFSTFNARLNGVRPEGAPTEAGPSEAAPGSVELRLGSLFEPLKSDERFDLVFVNPPFELVPEGASWFMHSHGGEDGLDLIRRLLPDVRGHMTPEGRFAIVTWSPGSAETIALEALLEQTFDEHTIDVHLLDAGPVQDHTRPFRDLPGYDAYIERLREQGTTHVHFVYAEARPGPAGVHRFQPKSTVAAAHAIADAWLPRTS